MFETFRRGWAIKSYLKKLPPALRERYGRKKKYTEKQIRTAIGDTGVDRKHIEYALAALLCRNDFMELPAAQKGDLDYDALREDIGLRHFGGDPAFSIQDVFQEAEGSSSWMGGGGGVSGDVDYADLDAGDD